MTSAEASRKERGAGMGGWERHNDATIRELEMGNRAGVRVLEEAAMSF